MGAGGATYLAGAGISAAGRYEANKDQAEAEFQNAAFYREQAQFAQDSGDRDLEIHQRKSQIEFGEQVNAFAKVGNQSSDAVAFLAEQKLLRSKEGGAIKQDRDFNVRLATLRANQSQSTGNTLESFSYNTMQGMTALAGAGGKMAEGAE